MNIKKRIVNVLSILAVLSLLTSCCRTFDPVKPTSVKETHTKKTIVTPKYDAYGDKMLQSHESYEEYQYGY